MTDDIRIAKKMVAYLRAFNDADSPMIYQLLTKEPADLPFLMSRVTAQLINAYREIADLRGITFDEVLGALGQSIADIEVENGSTST